MVLFSFQHKAGTLYDTVYTHTLIVALSCVPTALSVGITINMVGKKLMLGRYLNSIIYKLLPTSTNEVI